MTVVLAMTGVLSPAPEARSFESQFCGLPGPWRERIRRGYFGPRSGQIAILPRYPAYSGTSEGGWSHSGPWGYLQRVPLVFYGPGVIPAEGDVERPVTVADIAPSLMRLMRGTLNTRDSDALSEALPRGPALVGNPSPRLIVVSVWDGGGWNVLERWPEAWPNLRRLMDEGTSFTNATVGSSPSVTPSVHTTIGTGVFPWHHGITGIPVRDENGEVVDSFLKGDSSRFIQAPAVAELWDEHHDNRAEIAMVGYEPWHLGMIGLGAEDRTGDKDVAVWLDTETNEWITNPAHYSKPDVFLDRTVLDEESRALDAVDGEVDRSWRSLDLDDPARIEETPAFIAYHGHVMSEFIEQEGYGRDRITDLLFTNFKQIDRLGHYFNMASEEVRQALEESDRQLGELVRELDTLVGRGRWAVVVTADHGQQPDARAVDGYGIDPKEVARDVDAEFGPITRAVWPTEVFLHDDVMSREGVTLEEVSRFLSDYRMAENTQRPDMLVGGAGRFGPRDTLFELAMPSRLIPGLACGRR